MAYISYVLLVCPHSPRWPTLTRCSSAHILHAGLLLLRVTRLTSFLLTYIRTCGRNAMLGITGLHLVRVARLSSFAALAYSYALLVCPHSLHWPTTPTCCSFDLIFADLRSDVWQKHRVRHHWPTSRTCCSSALILHAGVLLLRVSRLTSFLLTYIRTYGRNAVLGIGGLHLVRVAHLSSFAVLAYSYALLVCPHSPHWPTAPTRCSFDLIFADLRSDMWQKRLAYISYVLLVCPHSPRRPTRTRCSSALILLVGQHCYT